MSLKESIQKNRRWSKKTRRWQNEKKVNKNYKKITKARTVCVSQQEASRVPSTTEKDMRVGCAHFSSSSARGARTSSSDSAASANIWKAPIAARLSCCCCCRGSSHFSFSRWMRGSSSESWFGIIGDVLNPTDRSGGSIRALGGRSESRGGDERFDGGGVPDGEAVPVLKRRLGAAVAYSSEPLKSDSSSESSSLRWRFLFERRFLGRAEIKFRTEFIAMVTSIENVPRIDGCR